MFPSCSSGQARRFGFNFNPTPSAANHETPRTVRDCVNLESGGVHPLEAAGRHAAAASLARPTLTPRAASRGDGSIWAGGGVPDDADVGAALVRCSQVRDAEVRVEEGRAGRGRSTAVRTTPGDGRCFTECRVRGGGHDGSPQKRRCWRVDASWQCPCRARKRRTVVCVAPSKWWRLSRSGYRLRISDAPTIGPARARRGGENRCPAFVVRGSTWVHLALPPLTQRSRRAPGRGR